MRLKIKKRNQLYKPFIPIIDIKALENTTIAIDTECTGLNWSKDDRIFGIGLAVSEIKSYYFDWPVNPITRRIKIDKEYYPYQIAEICNNANITKVFANAKYDIHMLEQTFSIKVKDPIIDVLVAAWCCNTQEPSYSLKNLAKKYLNIDNNDEIELKETVISARAKAKKLGYNTGKKVEQDYWLPKTLDHNNNLCEKYCKLDCIRTLLLWESYLPLMKELGVLESFNKEMELTAILYNMEKKGVRFYKEKCNIEHKNLIEEVKKQQQFIRQETSKPELNISSPKQLIQLLYNTELGNDLPIPVIKTTAKGSPSTETSVLKRFRDIDIVEAILKYRGYDTGRKYCENYQNICNKDICINLDDMPYIHSKFAIYPNFNQINTCTGRLSSSNPNLQNVADPEKSNGLFVTDARSFFGPREGYCWVCIDYSQLEARIFAEIAEEKEMIKIFNDIFRDPFTELGDRIYGDRFPEGIKRKITKNVFYCKIFCGGPNVLAEKYDVKPVSFARQVLDELGEMYPGIISCQKKLEQTGKAQGYIKTLFDRKINIDPDFSYRAISYIVQGTAADLIKKAMIKCSKFIYDIKNKYDISLLLSVHDELVFEVKIEHALSSNWLTTSLQRIMEDNKDIMNINTPTKASITYNSWSSNEQIAI